jgi:hypothetical protein
MAATPLLPAQGFERTAVATKLSLGKAYPHDAFGVDSGGRVRPHSGHDSTPTVTRATARTVLQGQVSRTGFSVYAGNFVEVDAEDGWLWLTLHLASIAVAADAPVDEGQGIGIAGNTGGGGALGKASMFVHVHTSRCVNRAAADRILNGLVRGRIKGETSAEWAHAMGLSDPWPIIRDGYTTAAPTPVSPQQEEDPMRVYANAKRGWAVVGGFHSGIRSIPPGAGDALMRLTGQTEPDRLTEAEFDALWRTFTG